MRTAGAFCAVGTLVWLIGCGSDSAVGDASNDGGSSAGVGHSGGRQEDQAAGRSGADDIGGTGGSAGGDAIGGAPSEAGTSSGGSGTGGAAAGGAAAGGAGTGGAVAGAAGTAGAAATPGSGGGDTGGAPSVGGSGGASGAPGTGGSGTGGSGTSDVPVYQPPTHPPLSDGPCRFATAAPDALCGGQSDCPVLVDAQLGMDNRGMSLDIAPASDGGAYVVARGNVADVVRHCFFTISSTGDIEALADPFPPAANGGISPAYLATDAADAPHAFLVDGDSVVHVRRIDGSWTPETWSASDQVEPVISDVVSSPGLISVLYSTHPPGESHTLQVSSGDGSGPWTQTLAFDAAGTQELMGSGLSLDATGQAVATYYTRADASTYDLYAWRAGTTTPLGNVSPLGHMVAIGDASTMQTVAVVGQDDGLHLLFRTAGEADRDLVVPGSARELLDECPVYLGEYTPTGCDGHDGEACTQRGRGTDFLIGPRRTDDGAIWFGYAVAELDQDVVLYETCTTIGGYTCRCDAEVTADRSFRTLFLARAATAAATDVELRYEIPLARSVNPMGNAFRLETRGNLLYVGYDDSLGDPTVFRYLVLDWTRL